MRFLSSFKWYWINLGTALVRLKDFRPKRLSQLLAAFFGWRFDVTTSWGVGYWVVHNRILGKLLGPIVDLVALIWDAPRHAYRTAQNKPRPPKGPGSTNTIAALFLVVLSLRLAGCV